MLSVAAHTPVWLYAAPADMRKSFDGLSGLVTAAGQPGSSDSSAPDLLGGGLFVFHNKRKDRAKILYFDGDGLAIWYKRLEKGTFAFLTPKPGEDRVRVSASELRMVLEGVDLTSVKRQKRYSPPTPEARAPDPDPPDDHRADQRA